MLGDAVNLGSRLESITKFYGAAILVSESTYAAVQEAFVWREVDYMQVKGKKEAIRVYEPLVLRARKPALSYCSKSSSMRRRAQRIWRGTGMKHRGFIPPWQNNQLF